MRALYLTNETSSFNTLIPEALEMQSIEVTVRTSPVEAAIEADAIISDRYPYKIPGHVCDQFAGKSINLHSSMLPRYRGSYPILFSVLAGEDPGWSLHRIDRVIDDGEVLFQKHVHTDLATDTLRTLWLRCQLEMMAYLASNFSYFCVHSRFPDSCQQSRVDDARFYYRSDLSQVNRLLTKGWDTPVSELYGLNPI